MITPNYIMVNDESVSREQLVKKIYRDIDAINEKSPDVAYPPSLKNILLFCAKHNLWEVCKFIGAETCFCIYKSWFDEIEKLTWQNISSSDGNGLTKQRTEFFFALRHSGVKDSVFERFRKEALKITQSPEPITIRMLLDEYEEKTLGERLPTIQRFQRYVLD